MDLSTLIPLPIAATDWVAAASGVVGVIVGSLITISGTIWVQKAATKREREAKTAEHNATVAILRGSLLEIASFLRKLRASQAWQAPFDEEWVAVWQDRGHVLAGFADRQTYETVAAAFLVPRLLRWQAPSHGQTLSDTDRKLIATWLERVGQGLEELEGLK